MAYGPAATSRPLVKQIRPMRTGQYYRTKARISQVILHSIMLLISLAFLLPLLLIVSGSFSDDGALYKYGYGLIPHTFSTLAYQYILADSSQLVHAYGITIFVTLTGTGLSLVALSLVAYALSRQDFLLKRWVSFVIFFTMLFNGGLVPTYILITEYLHIDNTLIILIIPGLMMSWYVFLLRAYFSSLPKELIDAAKIDGASEWRILFQIVMPLSRPALATVALFLALFYWNDWFYALLYVDDPNLQPLQLLLYKISTNAQFLSSNALHTTAAQIPTLSAQMAMAVLAVGPIVFIFLALQKHFIRGITMGGIKGD